MFSQAGAKNSVHGGRGCHIVHPLWADIPQADTLWADTPIWADTPPGQTSPQADTPAD